MIEITQQAFEAELEKIARIIRPAKQIIEEGVRGLARGRGVAKTVGARGFIPGTQARAARKATLGRGKAARKAAKSELKETRQEAYRAIRGGGEEEAHAAKWLQGERAAKGSFAPKLSKAPEPKAEPGKGVTMSKGRAAALGAGLLTTGALAVPAGKKYMEHRKQQQYGGGYY